MKKPTPAKPVERMFPFVVRARLLLTGREILQRSRSKLHFVLVTTDLSEESKAHVLSDFAYYPVVQHFTSADLETFFGVHNAKVVGFVKSTLAQSIYAELKAFRLNKPEELSKTRAEARRAAEAPAAPVREAPTSAPAPVPAEPEQTPDSGDVPNAQ
jgi:hypothetical protein